MGSNVPIVSALDDDTGRHADTNSSRKRMSTLSWFNGVSDGKFFLSSDSASQYI